MKNYNTLFKALTDLLVPRKCIVCEEKLTLEEEHLCRWCREDMPLTRFWIVGHNKMADKLNANIQKELEKRWTMNLPTGQDQSEDIQCNPDVLQESSASAYERYAYAAALFYFNEEGGYKKIPYRIKYGGGSLAGRHFGRMLGGYLASAQWFGDIDVIIPVPLHWKRRWKRGYNQAETIAEGISDVLGVPVREDILKRRRNTRTQINLDVEDKAANVAGAFTASMSIPDSRRRSGSDTETGIFRHILLVDDVFTTGSTLTACFLALREIFPREVRISVATLGFVGRF